MDTDRAQKVMELFSKFGDEIARVMKGIDCAAVHARVTRARDTAILLCIVGDPN